MVGMHVEADMVARSVERLVYPLSISVLVNHVAAAREARLVDPAG